MVFYDNVNEVLVECVKACGGSKSVGVEIWPAKGLDAAQRHLLNCLNNDRNEKLSPDEVLLIARMARDVGCHVYVEYLAQALSYSKPTPVEPVDELKELMRANNELRAKQIAMSERVEKLLARSELKGQK
jgi:hypothetical protein